MLRSEVHMENPRTPPTYTRTRAPNAQYIQYDIYIYIYRYVYLTSILYIVYHIILFIFTARPPGARPEINKIIFSNQIMDLLLFQASLADVFLTFFNNRMEHH